MKHIRKIILTLAVVPAFGVSALDIKLDTPTVPSDTVYSPDVIYSPIPKSYEIAGIDVTGIPESDHYLVIGFSGLSVGDASTYPARP